MSDDALLILSLETATRAGSLAVARGKDLLASKTGEEGVSHSINLLRDVESLLASASVDIGEIEVFATATGPGSFTGLRIGLATVKAFAATLGRKCVGIQTLHAVAHACGASKHTYALLPAGRGEVFGQLLSVYEDGTVQPLLRAEHISPIKMLEQAADFPVLRWAGAGAHQNASAIRARAQELGYEFVTESTESGQKRATLAHGRWTLAPLKKNLAENVALLAWESARQGLFERPEDLRAEYVRPSDAELNQSCP